MTSSVIGCSGSSITLVTDGLVNTSSGKLMSSEDSQSSITKGSDVESVTIEDDDEPRDRFHLVYIIFLFIGISALLPWNFFLNANDYFRYQLRNQSDPINLVPNDLQKSFGSYLVVCSLVPSTIGNFVNLMLKDAVPVFVRVIASLAVMLTCFILTTILAKTTISTYAFLGVTLVTVVINNLASAINQGSTYGVLAAFPGSNAGGYLQGQAIAGIIAAVAMIIVIAVSGGPAEVGFGYFLLGSFVVALSAVLFILLFKNAYFQYFWENKGRAAAESQDNLTRAEKIRTTFRNLCLAMADVKWTGSVCFLTFAVTLIIYPNLLFPINPVAGAGTDWATKYFGPVVYFLNFNVFDYLGRLLVSYVKWPRFEQRVLFVCLAALRVLFIPAFMFCNHASPHLPVLFNHDSAPIIFVMLLGLTNGYFVSLAVTYGARYAKFGNAEGCGMATSTYIGMGLCTGGLIAMGMVKIY